MELENLFLGELFNASIENLPIKLKRISIFDKQIVLFKKIPFGCKIYNKLGKKIYY